MSSTNKTTYYELAQYVGTDIINPLTDFNGDNEKIDTALHNIAEAAGSSAADITALAGRVTTEEGKVSALETQNGSDVLVTTAQTLSGAINELKSVNDTQSSTLSAHTSSIDNLASRMTTVETKVSAIESNLNAKYLLEADVSLVETYTSMTCKNIINDAMAKLKTYVQGLDDDEYVEINGLKMGSPLYVGMRVEKLIGKTAADSDFSFDGIGTNATTNGLIVGKLKVYPADYTVTEIFNWTVGTGGTSLADITDTVLTTVECGFELRKYKKVG